MKDILNPKLPREYIEEEGVIVKIKAGQTEPKPEFNNDLEEQKIGKPDSPGEYFEENGHCQEKG